jgi:hypothetical protein
MKSKPAKYGINIWDSADANTYSTPTWKCTPERSKVNPENIPRYESGPRFCVSSIWYWKRSDNRQLLHKLPTGRVSLHSESHTN